MKRIFSNSNTSLLLIAFLLLSVTTYAQDFQGVATYKSHRKVDLKVDNETVNSEMNKQIQEQLRKQFQREYTLTFNKEESLYKQNEQLDAPSPMSSGIRIQVSQGSDILFKNVKENRFVNQTEIFGKQFLVKDTLTKRNWKLGSETKNIGEYTCFNATFEEEYTTQTVTESNEMETVTKNRTTTAWYTPQIPVNIGPDSFQGLPGLILEINDGDLTLVCTKIVLNPKESFEIKVPTKGKEVTQEKFDDIMEKKSKEMMEQVQSRRKDGDNIIIKIGG